MINENKIKLMLKKAEQLADIYEVPLNLGFSGGKDSIVLKYFADLFDVKYEANFNNTQIEMYKGMLPFIKENYPDVSIVNPDKADSFFVQMRKHGLPSIFRRWCCDTLKHSNPKNDRYTINIMGVRAEESRARAERGEISVFGDSKRAKKKREDLIKTFTSTSSQVNCVGGKDKVNIYPIFELTDRDIWDVIKSESLVVPPVYNNSTRCGCAFCPFASTIENLDSIKNNPAVARSWIKTFDDEFMSKRQKRLYGNVDAIELFYLYVFKQMESMTMIRRGIVDLKNKDLFGVTGQERFTNYLKQCNVIKP